VSSLTERSIFIEHITTGYTPENRTYAFSTEIVPFIIVDQEYFFNINILWNN